MSELGYPCELVDGDQPVFGLHHRKDALIHKEEPMAQILAVGLHASDDPTLATLLFITAVGAIGLVGEAASLARSIRSLRRTALG